MIISAKEYIKSDLYRYTGNVSLCAFIINYFNNRSFKFCFWLRLSQVPNKIIQLIARIMRKHYSNKYGLQIPRQTRIGYGLYIGHEMCIVIHPSARIGNNCNLGQFTTIGSNLGKAAIIGDNVYIGPNVCIVEDVIIGDNSTIGAGSVVVKNVPELSTVAGNPASVISYKTPARYIHNKYEIKSDRNQLSST